MDDRKPMPQTLAGVRERIDEIDDALSLVSRGDEGRPQKENWRVLAHALLASNEFLFVD